jgi:hypothetical protein
MGRRWYGTDPPPTSALRLAGAETFDEGVVWLRYGLDGGSEATRTTAVRPEAGRHRPTA